MIKLINSYLTESDIAEIARISTGKKKRSDEALVRHLLRQGHMSVFRHAVMTFEVEVPIYTTRQWTRHVVGSNYLPVFEENEAVVTEKSGRYSEMEGFSFDIPEIGTEKYHEILEELYGTLDSYKSLLEAGARKEQARKILPLCTVTKFIWTVNLDALMHFLSNRMDSNAQEDILENAKKVYEIFKNHYPNIADEWAKKEFAVKRFLKEWRVKDEVESPE